MSSCYESFKSWWVDCWARYNKPMTPREYLRLNAWQKWQLFRRPPWKFVINLIIVICATTQVILLNTYFAPFNRANVATWNYLLTPRSNPSGDEFGPMTIYHIYQVPDLVDSVQQTLDVYYGLRNTSVDYFEFFYQDGDPTQPLPVTLTVETYKQGPAIFDLTTPFDDTVTTQTYVLDSPENLGPFAEDHPERRDGHELNTYVHYLYKMRMDFNVRNYEFADTTRLCFKWGVTVAYDFSVRGRIDMTVNTNTQLCPEERRIPWYQRALKLEMALYFLLAFFAAISQVLHLKAIYRSIIIFQEARLATITRKLQKKAAQEARKREQASVELSRSGTGERLQSVGADATLTHDAALPGGELSVNSPTAAGAHPMPAEEPLLAPGPYSDVSYQTAPEEGHPQDTDAVMASSADIAVTAWSELSFRDKLRFFNMWFVLATIGNLCNMVGPLLSLRNQVLLQADPARLYFLGLGCMMAWVNVVQYFEGASSYYVLITTLRKGTPRVCRFLIGVLPVFLGYAMFGVAFFSSASEKFATIDAACVTLFALLNGDVVHDIFDDLYPLHPTISRIYLYTFICLFIYAVLNIFIAIIEDAFFASKAFQLHGQPELEDKEKDDQVDPLLLLEFEGMFGDGASSTDDSDNSSSSSGSDDSSSSSSSSSSSTSSSSSSSSTSSNSGSRHRRRHRHTSLSRHARALGSSSHYAAPPTASEVDDSILSASAKPTSGPLEGEPAFLSETGAKPVVNPAAEPAAVTSGLGAEIDVEGAQALWPSLTGDATSAGARVSNATAGTNASTDVENSDLLNMLSQAQASLNADLTTRFAALLSSKQVQQKQLRPPHHPSFFPCGFPDCVYCIVRSAAVKTINEAQKQLQNVFEEISQEDGA